MKKSTFKKAKTAILPLVICLFLLIMSLSTTSCRKSEDQEAPIVKVYPEENPLAAFYTASGLTKIYEELGVDHYESGLKFSTAVKGKINAITLRLPEATNNVRVTIWDNDTKAVIRTITIDVPTAGILSTKTIEPIYLEKSKEYTISMNTISWYLHKKPDNSEVTFPLTAGNIKFLGMTRLYGTNQIFPATLITYSTLGEVSMIFQQVD